MGVRTAHSVAAIAVAVALVAGALGLRAYDRGQRGTIAEGIAVGGVDVSGLDRAAATDVLSSELVGPLTEPVVVRFGDERFTLTAQVARVRADVDAMVDEALRRSRRGTLLARSWRRLTGGSVEADLEPNVRFSDRAVRNLVERVARNVDRRARNADVRFTAGGLERVRSRTGLKVRRTDLRRRVERALLRPDRDGRRIRARVRRTTPKVTTREVARRYGTVVHVSRGSYTLRLYKKLKLVRSYRIAVGEAGRETPAGLYDVQNKAVNPAWTVPNSDWAGALAGRVIPPGPENPLKARWLGIYDGAGIHGTDQRASIGTNASKGCIRMLVEDVVELYDRVPVGAPVYIA